MNRWKMKAVHLWNRQVQDVCREGNAGADKSLLYVEPFQDNTLVGEVSTHPHS